MRPLYDARVSDLGPGDLVKVECACGHAELLTAAMLATAGVGPERKVLDLGARMRCRECDSAGAWWCRSGGRASASKCWLIVISDLRRCARRWRGSVDSSHSLRRDGAAKFAIKTRPDRCAQARRRDRRGHVFAISS